MGKPLLTEDKKRSLQYLGRWSLMALFGGVVGFGVVWSFKALVVLMQTGMASVGLPLFVWALAGAAMTGGLLYKIDGQARGEGGPAYILGVLHHGGRFSLRTTAVKFFAALATLGTWGSGGVVGPLGRVSAGVSSSAARLLFNKRSWSQEYRTAAICGFAGCVGAVFHGSLGAGIFAVEIIQRQNMRYRDLFPSVMASCVSVFLCRVFDFQPFFAFSPQLYSFDPWIAGLVILVALAAALVGRSFSGVYRSLALLFRREQHNNRLFKAVLGTVFAAVPCWFISPGLMGTGGEILDAVLNRPDALSAIGGGVLPLGIAAVILLGTKLVSSCLTVGGGLSAGFTGPMVLVGMLLGVAVSSFFGIEPLSGNYYALLAAGFSGVLASCINVPISAAVLSVELFGIGFGLPGGIAAVIGFQLNRHSTIYDAMDRSSFGD